jgi:hypothetical protein
MIAVATEKNMTNFFSDNCNNQLGAFHPKEIVKFYFAVVCTIAASNLLHSIELLRKKLIS